MWPSVAASKPLGFFSQEGVVTAFRKLFPADWFAGFKFPMIEDIINQEPFSSYLQWRVGEGLPWDGPLVPSDSTATSRLVQRHADGQQAGALNHRAALPSLVSFGLSMDEHFAACQTLLVEPTPLEKLPLFDDDLSFAAWATSGGVRDLQAFRIRAIGLLKELVSRWKSVDAHLRKFPSSAIMRVTSSRNVGVPGLLMILLSWGDFSYPHSLIKGLPAVGLAPNYGVFPVQSAQFLSFKDVLADADGNNASILAGLRPG